MVRLQTSGRGEGQQSRVRPVHLLAAAAILGLLVMPVAFAAEGNPSATKSANLTKQIKKLKRTVAGLQTRLAAVEARPDQVGQVPASLPPSGPAGGDLTGAYPNPTIASGAVNSAKVLDNSLAGGDINESSLGEVPSATLGGLGGETGFGGPCDPESSQFIACATASTTLPALSRVLIIGQIRAEPDTGGGNGGGSCGVAEPFIEGIPVFVNGGQTDVIAISGITGPVGPGPASFGLWCNETASGVRYFDGSISFVALSPSVAP
jgi:hypothetical protein